MKIVSVFIFLSTSTLAYFDLNLAAAGRSYPSLGGSFYIESGYNIVLWEKNKESLYGLIRPSVYIDSSVVINTFGQKIGFYPVSFLGIEIGKETVDSQYAGFTYYDCDMVACIGIMEKEFITYKLGLSASNLVTTGAITYYKNKYDFDLDDAQVGEFLYNTLANSAGDEIYFSRYLLGLKAMGGFIGIITDFAKMVKSGQSYESNYLIYGFKTQLGSFSVGAGNMKSDEIDPGAVIYLRWSYWPFPSKLLF